MHHYRKTIKSYASHNEEDKVSSGCTFCKEVGGKRITYENETMYLMANRVSYDMFEGRRVLDHLMVIPKRHVETLADFTDQEKIDQMTIAGEYESKGYNVYARGAGSISRTVKHQHTHLIKLLNKKSQFFFFMQKPYVLIDK
ncbi:MAG TPA: HIT domain-containing protein [Candidatus Saccharimonadales bacterium]|nr:HIT domain-containing protein [Candidatus Saccharimonadales bacterium]